MRLNCPMLDFPMVHSNLQQPGVSMINCAAMTWSEQAGSMYCRERTRFVYESRQCTGPVCPIHVIRALIILAPGCRNYCMSLSGCHSYLFTMAIPPAHVF